MALQLRRGAYEDFDPDKMVAAEVAVVTSGDPNSNSGRSIYMCFEPGVVKRLADYEDILDLFEDAEEEATERAEAAAQSAESSASAAEAAAQTAATEAAEEAVEAVQSQLEDLVDEAQEIADSIPEDYTALSNEVEELEAEVDTKAPAIYCTTSGSLVTIPDGADSMPLKNLTVDVEAVQSGSGDPSPTNIRPISGWTSAKIHRTKENLLGGIDFANQVQRYIPTATIDTDEKTVGFGAGAAVVSNVGNLSDGIHFKENTAYTLIAYGKNTYSSGSNTSNIRVHYTDGTNANPTFANSDGTLSYIVFTSNPNKTIRTIAKYNGRNGTLLYYDQCGIFEGELTVDDFAPYEGTTYDITFPSSAGTVYGGTVDVTNGTLTVDKGYKTFNSSDGWTLVSSGLVYHENVFGSQTSTSSSLAQFISNKYVEAEAVQNSTGAAARPNGTFFNQYVSTSNRRDRCWIRDDSISTLEELGAALAANPVQFVYPLDTPVTITLDPTTIRTLLGLNNIWADTGAIEEVTYAADTKMYIEELTKPTEDDMVANSAIEAGTFFMIGNKLFLSTASIANGATITPGTNATEMSLSEALNTLNS